MAHGVVGSARVVAFGVSSATGAAGVVGQRLADGLARCGGPVRRRAAGGLREPPGAADPEGTPDPGTR
jgi:hypothetical protein